MRPAPPRLLLLLALMSTAACEGRRNPSEGTAGTRATCGNGRVERGETCDVRIATSSAGACPARCDDGVACTVDRLLGTAAACNVECAFDPISACQGGDGCCPAGCTAATDSDCSSTCGNGSVDSSETCDGDCPLSCDDHSACTTDAAYGAATTCSLTCGYRVLSDCAGGDGCCPANCSSDDDSDCSQTCGDGHVDALETCDGNCPTTCEEGNRCTQDIAVGSAENCNLACTHVTIRSCLSGDGCCPGGCTPAQDSDCSAPPPCTAATPCQAGDSCCPETCSFSTDADCPAPPAASIGSACTTTGDCAALSTPEASAYCETQWPQGYCTFYCTSAACPSGSHCDVELFRCIDDCSPSTPNDCRTGYVCRQSFTPTEQSYTGCFQGGP